MGGECPNCGAECVYCDDAETDYEGERVARLEAELAAERARTDALVEMLDRWDQMRSGSREEADVYIEIVNACRAIAEARK